MVLSVVNSMPMQATRSGAHCRFDRCCMERRRSLIALLAALASIHPWPSQAGPRRIGVLSLAPAESRFAAALRQGITEGLEAEGLAVGSQLEVDWRFGDGRVESLPAAAAALVRARVALIIAVLNYEIAAAIAATRSIPIVMLYASLPVELGYVASLSQPGGHVTGTTYTEARTAAKLMEFARAIRPGVRRVTILANLAYPGMPLYRDQVGRAGSELGMRMVLIDAQRATDVPAALTAVANSAPDMLFFAQDPVLATRMDDIVATARTRRWPTIGSAPQFAAAGGLLAYAPEPWHLIRRAAAQAARILAGQPAREIPVEQPSHYELTINLETARAIGLAVPRELLLRADKVIG
jgi:putative tryptophan/tyrosine transport system substrate-binding protein